MEVAWPWADTQTIRLTDLSIRRMTQLYTKATGLPSSQKKWEQIMGTPINWKQVWRTLQHPITNS
eukprot:6183175-Pleurochrysis_carterae.AAC.5